jgi:predicted PurR-regulated permease PerM
MTRHDPTIGAAVRSAWERRPSVRAFAHLAAILIGLYVCYLLTLPFLAALAWALALAVLAAPLHRRIEKSLQRPGFAAGISTVLLAVAVVIPLALLGQRLLGELTGGAALLQQQLGDGSAQRVLETHPLLAPVVAVIERHVDLGAILGGIASFVTGAGASIVRGSLSHLVTVLLTFYLLFYFLRDRRSILRQAVILSPLTEAETEDLFGRAADTVHAVIFGTVVAAAVQGTLGGAMFWLLGLPNPLLWGVVMALLAVIPLLGAFVVWIPAAAYLALTGEWGKAALLTAWGSIVIGGIDNLLHPVLAGGRLQLHTVPTFIAIVGGLLLFGASGLILGPLVVTLTIALLEVWRGRAVAPTA